MDDASVAGDGRMCYGFKMIQTRKKLTHCCFPKTVSHWHKGVAPLVKPLTHIVIMRVCTNQSIVHSVGYGMSPLLFSSPPVPPGTSRKSCCWFALRSRQTRFPTAWTDAKRLNQIQHHCNAHWNCFNYEKKYATICSKEYLYDFILLTGTVEPKYAAKH